MSYQKALILHSKDAGKFELGSRPIPTPGHGEVLIKVYAAALNPVDKHIQSNGYLVENYGFPTVAGSDGAGTIEAVGEGVTGFEKGDRVLFPAWWSADRGTFQQYALSDAARTAKIPSNMSFDEASTVPLGLGTAAMGLYGDIKEGFEGPGGGIGLVAPWTDAGKGKYTGKPILIPGGSTSVGQYATQLAKMSGFSPIIVTASQRNTEYCKAAGATHVIDYRETPYSQLPEAVAKITTQPIDVAYDSVAREGSVSASLRALAPGGSLVVVLPQNAVKPGSRDADGKLVVFCYGNVNAEPNQALGANLYSKITALLEDGSIKPNAVEVLPDGLVGTFDGLKRLASRSVSASKLVVHPQDTA
ncbi:GroES-like protein [Peniophora sp. CONT]|nr:GroES-like protein [Peniophora sp. CONT]